jgi:hypothetical protein
VTNFADYGNFLDFADFAADKGAGNGPIASAIGS